MQTVGRLAPGQRKIIGGNLGVFICWPSLQFFFRFLVRTVPMGQGKSIETIVRLPDCTFCVSLGQSVPIAHCLLVCLLFFPLLHLIFLKQFVSEQGSSRGILAR